MSTIQGMLEELILTLYHPLPPAHKQMPKQDLCSICKLVVSFLEPFVDSNSTEVKENI